jgi:hypothetical protein
MAGGGGFLQVYSVAANVLNTHSRTADKWYFSSLGTERGVHNFMQVRCLGHMSRMGELRNPYKVLATKTQIKRSFQDLGADGNILN